MNALKLLAAQHDELASLAKSLATSDEVGRGALLDELADKLVLHLAVEQELLYPAVADLVGADVRDELRVEHNEIRRALADLLWYDDHALFERTVERLALLLDGHARWQADQLFTTIVETLSPTALVALDARVQACCQSPSNFGAVGELAQSAA